MLEYTLSYYVLVVYTLYKQSTQIPFSSSILEALFPTWLYVLDLPKEVFL